MRGDRQDQQEKLSDEQLVLNAQSDKMAIGELIARYICTVEFLAKKYGAEVHEDLVQEGLMGLLGAVRTYREDKNAKFSTYATKCIKNKIISSVHRNALLSGGEEADLEAILGGGGTVPEEVVVEREELNELYDKITSALSEQEWQVFQSFLRGMSYNQIGGRQCNAESQTEIEITVEIGIWPYSLIAERCLFKGVGANPTRHNFM